MFKLQNAKKALGASTRSPKVGQQLESRRWLQECIPSDLFDQMNAVKKRTKGTVVHTDQLSVKSSTTHKNLKTPEVASESQTRLFQRSFQQETERKTTLSTSVTHFRIKQKNKADSY